MSTPPPQSRPTNRSQRVKPHVQVLANLVNRFDEPEHVVHTIRRHLETQPQLAVHVKSLRITYDQGALEIHGMLPSFYLKQLLQTALKGVSGIETIRNQVAVPAAEDECPRGDVTK